MGILPLIPSPTPDCSEVQSHLKEGLQKLPTGQQCQATRKELTPLLWGGKAASFSLGKLLCTIFITIRKRLNVTNILKYFFNYNYRLKFMTGGFLSLGTPQVDLGGLPPCRSTSQASSFPDALQIFLKFDLTLLLAPLLYPPADELPPLDQLLVLVPVHLPPADLQHIPALHSAARGSLSFPHIPRPSSRGTLGRLRRFVARFFLSALGFGQGVPHCQPALQGADGEFPGNQDLLQLRVQRVPLLGLGPAGVGGLGAVACGWRTAAEEGGH